MKKNYECPVLEILIFKENIYASIENSDINFPSDDNEGSNSTGWLPWV